MQIDPFLNGLLADQQRAIAAVAQAVPAIAAAATALAAAFDAGGRLIYVGAGSSGLIAVQDGAELPGTFGLDADRIVFVIAGGLNNLARMDGGSEDDRAAAADAVAALGDLSGDIIIAVSASGSTPFTLAAAQAAKGANAKLICMANRPQSPLLLLADVPVLLETGPETLHGSTRMAAGTAQKAALGLISTLANAELGHVYGGHMVNVQAANAKLRERAAHIVASIAGVDSTTAAAGLALAQGDVKCAIMLAAGASSHDAALAMLAHSRGRLEGALAKLRAGEQDF